MKDGDGKSGIKKDKKIIDKSKEISKKTKNTKKNESPSVDDAAFLLKEFFENNPYSSIELLPDAGGALQIVRPWDDASLSIILDKNFSEISNVLNEVVLPKKFSAIWHRDERKLEVIWTAYQLTPNQQEIDGRKFNFDFCGIVHQCEFGLASERLMIISKYARPLTVSTTNHRNLSSFSSLAHHQEKGITSPSLSRPRCFWIDNIDYEEGLMENVSRHLSFYLAYYDVQCPTILIHDAPPEKLIPKRTRYIKGRFPTEITGRELDENMLSFWISARFGNPMLQFLLYYRVIEYAAFHFIEESIHSQIRKILLSPDARSDVDEAVASMVAAMSTSKLSDAQRLQSLFRGVVDANLLWRDIKANLSFFSKDTIFDGGFSVRAMVASNENEANFRPRGPENVADTLRKIRNALAHGKDQETAGVIRPTSRNFDLFSPWVHLIATAAGEVVLYKDVT